MLLTIKGFQGMVSPGAMSRPEIQANSTASPSMWNVECWPRGTLSKRAGLEAEHSTTITTLATGAKVVKVFTWVDAAEVNHNIVFTAKETTVASAAIYAATLSANGEVGFTVILTGGTAYGWTCISADDVISCTTYSGSAIFCTDSSSALMRWNGDTAVACTSVSAAPFGAGTCQAWGGYLFLGNVLSAATRKESRVEWCTVNNIWSWPGSYWLDLDPDDGDRITGMTLFGDQIVVFKENKIFTINWVGGSLLFQAVRRSAEIGCVAGDTIVQKNGLVYFLSTHGVYAFDGQNVKCLSDSIIDKISTETNPSTIKISKAMVYDQHEQIFFAVPTGSHLLPDKIYVLDYATGGWAAYKFGVGQSVLAGTPNAMDIEGMATLTVTTDLIYRVYPLLYNQYSTQTIGSQTGVGSTFMAMVVSGTICSFGDVGTDMGSSFDAGWRSPWYDFGQASLNKRILRATVLADVASIDTSKTLNFDSRIDWDELTVKDAGSIQLSSATGLIREKRVDFTRACRAFQFTVSASSSTDIFTVHRFEIDYIPKGRTFV